jgi:hypothetical protein
MPSSGSGSRRPAPIVVEFDPAEALRVLERHRVAYVVVGALAAAAHGAPIVTRDLDVTPSRDAANLDRLAAALRDLDARLRTASDPDGVSLTLDGAMLATVELWTLITRAGELDVVFEPAGTRGFDDLRRQASRLEIDDGVSVLVASLADVVRSKEAAARAKDIAQLPLLRQTLERIREHERDA